MYSISSLKINKKTRVDGVELINLDGFTMPSKKNGFNINNQVIRDIKVISKDLAYPAVSKKVLKRYNKLIELLTELLISDDDSGDTFREALNQIEKFRLEIKNKYRSYLKKKELEMMSKQLSSLKREAVARLRDVEDSYLVSKDSGKSR